MEFYSFLTLLLAIGIPVVLSIWYGLTKKEDLFQKKNYLLIFSIIILSLSLLLISGVCWHLRDILYPIGKELSSDKLGQYGDLVGGLLNPILAAIGIIAASLAFYVQYQANQQVKDQFKIQQFESQFFEMLRLHKENINEMKIGGYGILMSNTVETGSGKIVETMTRTQIERPVEGRKVFVSMKKEFVACCEFCIMFNKQEKYNYPIPKILELAYKIFFFSSTSDAIFSKDFDEKFILIVKERLKDVRKIHKESFGQINSFDGLNGKKITLHIKYSPFTGHESRLGHYYRHLYNTVKYVVKNEHDGLFNYKKARIYLKLLRSQMSNDEQKMLYYNYIVGFGADWDKLGDKGNKFLTHYRMLHNLPLNNIKHVEDPKKHFEEFIKSIKNTKDPMFEWGDN